MNTTISPNGIPTLPLAVTNSDSASGQVASTATSGTAATQPDDSVNLTDSARALQASSASNQSPVDTARVNQIRQSLADGTYSVNANSIADRLTSLNNQINGTS